MPFNVQAAFVLRERDEATGYLAVKVRGGDNSFSSPEREKEADVTG